MSTSNPTTTVAAARGNGQDAAGGNGAAGSGVAGGPTTPARRPGPRELLVLHACVAAIIIYLVLNYFVLLRPGVSWLDHVLAVAVPVAALLFAAELWHRMSAGLRASLALVLGVLALVTGLVAAARVRVEGFGAPGVAGVMPLVAGALLVGLGAWLLWTSRKRGGALWWIVLRRALIAVGALLVVYWVILPVSMAIFATERPRDAVEQVGPRPAPRGRDADDAGRPEAECVVRAVAEPRRDRHLPARLDRGAGAHAGEARLRRAHGRSARLRRERGRPQRLRLGVGGGHRRGGRRGCATQARRAAGGASAGSASRWAASR